MNIKLICHLMVWELEHFLLVADKLKQSSYFINEEDTIYFDICLNLSEGIYDWDNSKLPKEYFIEKYNNCIKLLENKFIINSKIYEGSEVYGHLDLQKESIQKNIDYYVIICPDISFNEYTLYLLIESAKQIENKYFIITPQIFKSWDSSWDSLVNDKFNHIPYSECINHDIHWIHHESRNLSDESLEKYDEFKYAGWFDLFSKETYEVLFKIPEDWSGYGPWDFFTMRIAYFAKQQGVDIQQYVLKNNIIWFYDVGSLKDPDKFGTDGVLKEGVKKFLTLKIDRGKQRQNIEDRFQQDLQNWIEYAKLNKII